VNSNVAETAVPVAPAPAQCPVRIAIATDFPRDPGDPCGGVQAVSVHLVAGLARIDGLEIDVITQDRAVRSPETSIWGAVRVHRLPFPRGNVLFSAIGPGRRAMMAYLLDLKPDVVHAHDVYGLMTQGFHGPRVFTIHGQIYKDTAVSGEMFPAIRSWIWKRIELAGWARQHHIISISPYVREQASAVARGVIHDIDNPIGENCFDLPRREEGGRLFSAASIDPRKNTLAVVEAFARLGKSVSLARLHLSGSGPADYLQRVKNLISSRSLADRVKLLGRLPYSQIQEELSRAAVFVLASLEENSPMAIEEAMAAGLPVVTSNRCGMPYLVHHEESGFLIDPTDPDDIAWRLGQLLNDAELRRRMGALSRKIAEDRFHPRRVAEKTWRVYQRAWHDFQKGKRN
jgi:glycosyltransferase involved in cell wall biosynthesis